MTSDGTAAEPDDVLKRLPVGTATTSGIGYSVQGRSRRREVVTYQIRIDLRGTKPPLRRCLELASEVPR